MLMFRYLSYFFFHPSTLFQVKKEGQNLTSAKQISKIVKIVFLTLHVTTLIFLLFKSFKTEVKLSNKTIDKDRILDKDALRVLKRITV